MVRRLRDQFAKRSIISIQSTPAKESIAAAAMPPGATPASPAAGALEPADRIVRVGAERAAAVGDDLAVGGQLVEPSLELFDRDRACPLDVPGVELPLGPDVDQDDVTLLESLPQLLPPDRLDLVAEVVPRGPLDLSKLGRRGIPQS